jgi:hypothetical protein
MFSSFSPRAKRSRLAATTLQRRSAVASVLLELCGVISTFGNLWNGRRDGLRSGSAGVGYCHQTSSAAPPRFSAWGQRIWCGRTPRRPFSRVSSPWRTCHPPLRSRLPRCAVGCALEVRFALDSLWREMDSNVRSLLRKRKPESPSDRFDGSFFCGTDNSDPAFSAGEPSVPANLVRCGLAHYAG